MKHTRNTYQAGSIRKVQRKSGIAIWEYRYRDHSVAGSPMRQITLSTLEFPTKAKALVQLQEQVLKINGPDAFRARFLPVCAPFLTNPIAVKCTLCKEHRQYRPSEVYEGRLAFEVLKGGKR